MRRAACGGSICVSLGFSVDLGARGRRPNFAPARIGPGYFDEALIAVYRHTYNWPGGSSWVWGFGARFESKYDEAILSVVHQRLDGREVAVIEHEEWYGSDLLTTSFEKIRRLRLTTGSTSAA